MKVSVVLFLTVPSGEYRAGKDIELQCPPMLNDAIEIEINGEEHSFLVDTRTFGTDGSLIMSSATELFDDETVLASLDASGWVVVPDDPSKPRVDRALR